MEEIKNQFQSHPHRKVIAVGVITLLFSAALLLLAQFFAEMKSYQFIGQEIEFRNTITVSGVGEVTAIPDTAQFSFAVLNEAKNVNDAQEAVTTTMNNIIALLKKAGVDEKDIKTTNYTISPRYEYRTTGGVEIQIYPLPRTQVLVGYEVSHWVSVKVRETEDVGSLLSQIGNQGATNVSGVNFTLDDEDAVQREARQKAIGDAKEKAKLLAKDLGVDLVKIVSFNEYGGGPIYYRAESLGFDDKAVGAPSPVPDIPVGENTFTANVSITYAVE